MGPKDGMALGRDVGVNDGDALGLDVGMSEGATDGDPLGDEDGDSVTNVIAALFSKKVGKIKRRRLPNQSQDASDEVGFSYHRCKRT